MAASEHTKGSEHMATSLGISTLGAFIAVFHLLHCAHIFRMFAKALAACFSLYLFLFANLFLNGFDL